MPEPSPDAAPGAPAAPERLHGNVAGAVRVGDTVRRTAGPWTPAVHRLLAHLAGAGLAGIPTVIGTEPATGDDPATEVLGYIPGHSIDPDAALATEAQLTGAVRWLRAFHEAVAGFRPAEPLVWRGHPAGVELGPDRIVCHNDPGLYNWIVDGDGFTGMIDWDMAGPGDPIDDLAFLCWTGIPLHRDRPAGEVARRLRLVVAEDDRWSIAELLDAADRRMTTAADRIAAGQARGDAGLLNLARIGEPQRTRDRVAAFRARRPAIEAALAAG